MIQEELRQCPGLACDRQILVGVRYCCSACNPVVRVFDVHSRACDARHARRGEWKGDK